MAETSRFPRRRLLRTAGITIAAAVVVAACDSGDDGNDGDDASAQPSRADRELLRTASSLDELAVVVYQTAIDSRLVTTPEVRDTLELFRRHHREHAELFESATADAGGAPNTEPNPVVMQSLKPTIDAIGNEGDVLALALEVERVLAQTYQSFVGVFTDRSFDVATMSVGGTEARHSAVLAPLLGRAPAPVAFQPTDDAIPPGTGLPGA